MLDRPARGGNYHIVFVTEDGTECSFRGTYLEVEPPTRTVETWLFEGWPDADAVESVDLHETEGVTKLTMKLAFRDKAGRDHMTKSDGQEDSFNKMEDYLRSLLDQKGNGLCVVEARARLQSLIQGTFPNTRPGVAMGRANYKALNALEALSAVEGAPQARARPLRRNE